MAKPEVNSKPNKLLRVENLMFYKMHYSGQFSRTSLLISQNGRKFVKTVKNRPIYFGFYHVLDVYSSITLWILI